MVVYGQRTLMEIWKIMDRFDGQGWPHTCKGQVHQLICANTKPFKCTHQFCSSDTTTTITHVEYHEDVSFYWQTVKPNLKLRESKVHDLLLYNVVELFFTIHGHSKASAWMEHN